MFRYQKPLSYILASFAIIYLLSLPVTQWLQNDGWVPGTNWFELDTYYPLAWLRSQSVEACKLLDWYSNLLINPLDAAPTRTYGGVI